MNQLELCRAVEAEIRKAFRGVTLGKGVSLRQAQLADQSQNVVNVFHPSASGEIADDWSQVPSNELERNCCAHLDASGFCYYIPALMLRLLKHYDSGSMRVIGTLHSLYPKKGYRWEYHMLRYSLLNRAQKTAIA